METALGLTEVAGATLASFALALLLEWLCLHGLMGLMPAQAVGRRGKSTLTDLVRDAEMKWEAPSSAMITVNPLQKNKGWVGCRVRPIRFISTATHREKTETKPAGDGNGGGLARDNPNGASGLHENWRNTMESGAYRRKQKGAALGLVGRASCDPESSHSELRG